MKFKYISFLFLTLALAVTACSDTQSAAAEAEPEKELDTVLVARGEADARKVLELPENSQDREAAILEMRARETRLRQAGMNLSADSYHAGAARLLDRLAEE